MKHLFLLTTLLVIPLTGALAVEITDRSYLSYLHFLQGIIYAKQGEISKAEYELKKTIEIDKNAVTAHKELMLVYIQQGKLGEANNLALELAKLTQDTKTSLFLGSYYVVTGDTENAILHYENAYSSQKDNLEAISALAGIYSLIAPDKALKYFDEYAKLKPDSIEILYRKALVLVKLKKPDEAKQNLIDAIEKDPSDILLYITLAEIYESQKDFLAAAQSVERAIEKEPDNFTLQISAGSYYFFAKDLSKAEKIFMSVLKKTPNEPTALYWLSLISEERKDWEMAKYYLSFIKDDKKYPDIGKYLRMSYYYSHLNDRKKAVKTLEKAAKLDPKSPEVKFFLGLGYLDLKKYKKAEKNFLKAIELKPDMVDSHFYLGVIYEQTEKFEKAIPYFKKTIELESKNSNALNYLGYSFADRGINLDEAETLIKKALEIEPDNGAYMDSLGWTYFKKKDYINARLYLEKAASKLNDPVIFEHLGELEEVSGNNTGALDYYKKALKLDTKNKSYQNKIKLIEKKN